jgi:hypothetical protein
VCVCVSFEGMVWPNTDCGQTQILAFVEQQPGASVEQYDCLLIINNYCYLLFNENKQTQILAFVEQQPGASVEHSDYHVSMYVDDFQVSTHTHTHTHKHTHAQG